MTKPTNIPDNVMEEAVGWFGDLDDREALSDETRRRFAAWLTHSPVHIEAFLSVSAVHTGLRTATNGEADWLLELIADGDDNIVPLGDLRRSDETAVEVSEDTARHGGLKLIGLAAGLVVAIAIGVFSLWPSNDRSDIEHYATTLGEQRSVVLADGSVMQLNTESAAEVYFQASVRQITLLRGEAIFDVEKDPDRPFRVSSGSVTVEAIGTRFNVYRRADQTVVTVVEGRVAVEQSPVEPEKAPTIRGPAVEVTNSTGNVTGGSAGPVELTAGEQLAVRQDGAIVDTGAVSTERATAWTQRRVMFEDDTLFEVISEFNRYNRSKIVINDASLRERRFDGIFNVDDPEVFIDVLAAMTPIQVIERPDGTREIVSVAPAER